MEGIEWIEYYPNQNTTHWDDLFVWDVVLWLLEMDSQISDEVKANLYPAVPPEGQVSPKVMYYTVIESSWKDAAGQIFRNSKLTNLILDSDGNLLTLLSISTPEWCVVYKSNENIRLIQATEYRDGWRLVARKFEKYINQ